MIYYDDEYETEIEIEDTTGEEDPTTTSAMIDMMKTLVETIAKMENTSGSSMDTHQKQTNISLKNFNV